MRDKGAAPSPTFQTMRVTSPSRTSHSRSASSAWTAPPARSQRWAFPRSAPPSSSGSGTDAHTLPTTDYQELARLLECHPGILFPLHVDASLRPNDASAVVGDMLPMQLAEAQAHRSVTREGQFRTAIALDVARSRGVDSLESRAALRFAPVAYGSPHGAFVVLVIQTDDGGLRALISRDKRQLPVISNSAEPTPSRDSIVTAATRFRTSLKANPGFDPHSFLVFSRPWLSVVACPLLGLQPSPQPGVGNEFSSWLTVDEVADCCVYLPVASEMPRVTA